MARALIWRRRAEEDLVSTYLRLGAESAEAAETFLDRVEEAFALLARHPHAGRLRRFGRARDASIRSWRVRGFEQLLFYRVTGGGLEIVRLLHGARDLDESLHE